MSQKVVVVYRSKTGYAKRYAQWLAEALKADLIENKNLSLDQLISYDSIICGGGIYAGQISGLKTLMKYFDQLKEKHLIAFATGASTGKSQEIQKVWETNLTEKQRKVVAMFYLRGGFDYSKLGMGDKVLMNLYKGILKKNADQDEDAKGMLEAYEHPVDFTDEKNILPIVELVHSFK